MKLSNLNDVNDSDSEARVSWREMSQTRHECESTFPFLLTPSYFSLPFNKSMLGAL